MKTEKEIDEFIVKNSPDGGFLQSREWLKFQQTVGRKTFQLQEEGFWAGIIEHELPIVGKYLYIPRGPITPTAVGEFPISKSQFPNKSQIQISNDQTRRGMLETIKLAKKENAGWIRIEPSNNDILELIRENIAEKVVKAPHDMQPKEIFSVDISKPAEQLLAEMKSKTRYNVGVAKKKNIKIISSPTTKAERQKHVEEFLRLTREMALRQGITTHPDEYYRKMIESLPEEMLKIYIAEFEGEVIAANLILFFGQTATYMHGASGNAHRNLMAPFLLQWQAILDAKEKGCKQYDFGGVKTHAAGNWEGITNFKLGFSQAIKPIEFPGSYDIILNSRAYSLYRGLQLVKAFVYKFRK